MSLNPVPGFNNLGVPHMVKKRLRFKDFQEKGIVLNWASLKLLIDEHGFPPDQLLSPNIRSWTEEEVEEWIASRPATRKPVPRRIRQEVE